MEFDHNNVRGVVEDRLSSLPDELIHHILSCLDMKFAVQTCSLSSRWKLLWMSMPCLTFGSWQFGSLPKFSKFVTGVLSHRNHQIEVSSLKLDFSGAASQVFVRKLASYAFSHNVQELTVNCFPKNHHEFPPCLFNSQSLKHFTLSSDHMPFPSPCITPRTPWDFPALTTLHISSITLCDHNTGKKSLDLFSKCVNLKNLTLNSFVVDAVEVFDIITPRLSNLILIDGKCLKVINLIAPQLENLTIIECSIEYMNAPQGLSSLCYKGYRPLQLSESGFDSLQKVTIGLSMYSRNGSYEKEDARKTVNMLQEIHSARNLTLNVNIVECISSFPDLLLHHPSPFSNLICLTIDSYKRYDVYELNMSTEARNFFLENSPSATLMMELPEAPPTRAMKQKEARLKKAKRAAEIKSLMIELKALVEQGNMVVERHEKAKAAFESLIAEAMVLTKQNKKKIEPERAPLGQAKESHKAETRMPVDHGLVARFKIFVAEMQALVKEEETDLMAIFSKKARILLMFENMSKREREDVEARYSQELEETEAYCVRLSSGISTGISTFIAFEKYLFDHFLTNQDVSSSKLPLASQVASSSSTTGC